MPVQFQEVETESSITAYPPSDAPARLTGQPSRNGSTGKHALPVRRFRAIRRAFDRMVLLPLVRFYEGVLLRRQAERLYLVFGGHIFFQTLRTAVKFDLFTLLSRTGGLTRSEIARHLNIDDQPARILLLGCVSVGLLRKRGENYRNSLLAEQLLVADSPRNIINYVELEHAAMYKAMPWLYEAVRENRNAGLVEFPGKEPTLYERLAHDPEVEIIFQNAMHELSVQANRHLVRFVDFSKVKHVVDVGGGDGTNMIELAQEWPNVTATVFDSPTVCEIARQNIASTHMADRVSVAPGDCFTDPFPAKADCFLFAHFFTIWSPEMNRSLLRKCFDALPSGGQVMIFNMMQRDDETGPLSAAIGSPYFLTLATGQGMLYTWSEYESWMRETGFESVRRQILVRDHGVIIGRKP
jgi:precorrin-6B methylase 2